jgi:hypothetical protein
MLYCFLSAADMGKVLLLQGHKAVLVRLQILCWGLLKLRRQQGPEGTRVKPIINEIGIYFSQVDRYYKKWAPGSIRNTLACVCPVVLPHSWSSK